MRAKHMEWNEIQMHVCGVCESPAIVETYEGMIYQCTSCWSVLYKQRAVTRGYTWDVEPDRDENGFIIDGTGSGLRKETDEEMRERTARENATYGKDCDGVVILKKRTDEEHRRVVMFGGVENQQARMLQIVLNNEGFDSLEALTDELSRLRSIVDNLWLIPREDKERVLSFAEDLGFVNKTLFHNQNLYPTLPLKGGSGLEPDNAHQG